MPADNKSWKGKINVLTPAKVTIVYQASDTGSSNGAFQVLKNDLPKIDLTGLGNEWATDRVRMGAPRGAGLPANATGAYYMDEYVSTR